MDQIRLDGDTQSRKSLDDDVIKEYSSLMADGHEFPPLVVVFDGADYWLVDGFHRRWAAIKAELDKMKCQVIEGTREDARWLSYGANKDHGLPRSPEDRRKAVVAALKHPKGVQLSDSKIAAHVGVDHKTVAKYREKMETAWEIPKVTERTGQDGKVYSTANIGKASPPIEVADEPEVEPEQDEEPIALPLPVVKSDPPSPRKPEPNVIGELKERFDAFLESLLDNQPPHIVTVLKDHILEVAGAL